MNLNRGQLMILQKKLLAFAIVFSFINALNTADAQNNRFLVSDSVTNGLFTPTAAERFFKTGINNFEKEIKFVLNAKYFFDKPLLLINGEFSKQRIKMSFFESENSIPHSVRENLNLYFFPKENP